MPSTKPGWRIECTCTPASDAPRVSRGPTSFSAGTSIFGARTRPRPGAPRVLAGDTRAIVEVIDRRVKLKKSGKNYSARCPFHEERSPSFSVNPDKQFYYCFGCGAGGNALTNLLHWARSNWP